MDATAATGNTLATLAVIATVVGIFVAVVGIIAQLVITHLVGRRSENVEAAKYYAEEISRIGRETTIVLQALTDEIRRYREDQRAEHMDNSDSFRELREAIRDSHR